METACAEAAIRYSSKSVKKLWRHPQDNVVLLLPTLEESKWRYTQGLPFLITFFLFNIEIKDDEKVILLQYGPNYDESVLSSENKTSFWLQLFAANCGPEIAALIRWPFYVGWECTPFYGAQHLAQ